MQSAFTQLAQRRLGHLTGVLRGGFVGMLCMLAASGISLGADESPQGVEFYERKIRPILVERCYECHAERTHKREGGLTLDTRAGLLAGGENGPLVDRQSPANGLLLQVIGYDGDIQMPPTGKLDARELGLLKEWIASGAPVPEDGSVQVAKHGVDFAKGKQFWSFQPLQQSPLPQAKAGALQPLDLWIQAKLTERGLTPSPLADRRTLIRRATFDLLGLPPTPGEVEAFVADDRHEAYERLIERLLASPHYGERWGRYWLDLMRYADGNKTSLEERAHAWLYRDWVIQALNDDLPYDEFVRRQLAADQISGSQPADHVALGFWGLSPEYFKELKLSPEVIKAIVADEWEERLDALGRTFLGLSIACARCHDHKFDPISAEDYYALAGVLASSRLSERYVVSDREATVVHHAQLEVRKLREQLKPLQGAKSMTDSDRAKAAELQAEVTRLERDTPSYDRAMAHVLDDASQYVLPNGPNQTKLEYKPGIPLDLALHIRGNPTKLGRVVPRRFLTVLSSGEPRTFQHGSGRLELAEAIVGEAAPLSARVIVNRVWAHHFGRGIVETVSDFGAQGDRPSHPQLLDDLARRFIAADWSLKWLHREIMTSTTYRQSSRTSAAAAAVDPENRLLWRMNRRRLDIEAWRDSMLAVSGNLRPDIGGPSMNLAAANNTRRTLYARIERSELDSMLRLFDFPDPSSHAPHREPTTTPLQQLFVLNAPLMTHQAESLAKQFARESSSDLKATIRHVYRQLLARAPTESELRLGSEFLSNTPPQFDKLRAYVHALLGSNEFLFID